MDTKECCDKISSFLNNLTPRLSPDEIKHLRKLKDMFFNNKTIYTLVKIIIIIEEKRVPLGQDLGDLTQELISLLLPRHHKSFTEFAKQQRFIILEAKLQKTFKDFDGNVTQYHSSPLKKV